MLYLQSQAIFFYKLLLLIFVHFYMFAIDNVWLHRYPMDTIHFPGHFSIFCHANDKNYTVLKIVKDAITCITSHSIWVILWLFDGLLFLYFFPFSVLECKHYRFYAVTLNAIRMKYHNEAFLSWSLLFDVVVNLSRFNYSNVSISPHCVKLYQNVKMVKILFR